MEAKNVYPTFGESTLQGTCENDFDFPYEAFFKKNQEQEKKQEDRQFKILIKRSQMCIDVNRKSKNPDAQLIQWPFKNYENQKFAIYSPTPELEQEGYVVIKSINSGLVLQPHQESKKQSIPIVQNEYTGKDCQLFQIIQQDDKKSFCIQNKFSGMVLDIAGNSQIKGTAVQQYPFHGGDNQSFFIEEI